MNWTKTPPTKPGDYRRRWPLASNYALFNLPEGGKVPPSLVGCEWCGPLVPVEEVRRAYYEGHIHAISSDPDMDPQEHSWPNSRARKIVEGEL